METKTARIEYLLSEAGRKASLLAGGDGWELQVIETEATPEIIRLAQVDPEGNILLRVGFCVWNGHPDRITVSVQLKTYYHALDKGRPYWNEEREIHRFDEPQTVEKLLAWERERVNNTVGARERLQPEYERLQAQHEAYEESKRIENKKAEESREAERKAREEAEKAAKEAREAERVAWITEHGSDYLRRATKLGYNCQRQYVAERAALELPDFQVDFDSQAAWKSRSCPSLEALNEVERLIETGHKAEVVWLTYIKPDDDEDDDWNDDEFEACEAIVIHNYLSRYTLVKVV